MIPWRPVLAPERDADGDLPPFAVRHKPSTWRLLAEIPLIAALALAVVFPVKTWVAQAFFIPSGSMVPQLEVGDRVLVSKLSYRLHEPRRGDVIVFENPERAPEPDAALPPVRVARAVLEAAGVVRPRSEDYIKRVIALPGETFEVRAGRILIDGRELVEPYLPAGTFMPDHEPVVVGADQLWVMGDNRPHSRDSRFFGAVDRDSVVGRAVLRLWPPQRVAFL